MYLIKVRQWLAIAIASEVEQWKAQYSMNKDVYFIEATICPLTKKIDEWCSWSKDQGGGQFHGLIEEIIFIDRKDEGEKKYIQIYAQY